MRFWMQSLYVVQVLRKSPPFLWWRFPVLFLCTWDCLTDGTRTSVSSRRRSGPALSRSWTTAFVIRTKVTDQHYLSLRGHFCFALFVFAVCLIKFMTYTHLETFNSYRISIYSLWKYFLNLNFTHPNSTLNTCYITVVRLIRGYLKLLCSLLSLLLFFFGGHGDTLIIFRIAKLSSCVLVA